MIIDDFNEFRATIAPLETDTPLIIDPDAVLTATIALQRLQSIARRQPQIAQVSRRVKISELPPRDFDQIGRKAFRALTLEDGFRQCVPESSDHASMYH